MKKWCVIFVCGGFIASQDIHYTQYHMTPLFLNPALTGLFPGQHRVILNYRNQWSAVPNAYQTFGLQGDMNLGKGKSKYGVGLVLYNDQAGNKHLRTFYIGINGSGIVPLSDNLTGSAGIQVAYAQRSVDYSADLNWPDEAQGSGDEIVGAEKKGYPTINAGIHINYYMPQSNMVSNDELGANLGISLFHITRPTHFPTPNELDKLYMKLMIHAGLYIGLFQTNLVFLPQFYMVLQGPYKEILPGAMVRYRLREESKYTGFFKETAIAAGAQLRTGDAVAIIFQAEYANFTLAFSYDIATSDIRDVVKSNGGPEISLRFINPNPFRYGKGTSYSVRFL